MTDLHIEHVAEAQVPESPATKKRRLSYTEKSPVPQRSYADVEEWEDVKELFANAVDKYEGMPSRFWATYRALTDRCSQGRPPKRP